MIRGEVWWALLPSRKGEKLRKPRLVVIVSHDASNRHLDRAQVVPLTPQVGRVFPSEAAVQVGGRRCKAKADRVTTVSRARFIRPIGRLGPIDMEAVDRALSVQLGLTAVSSVG